MRIPSTWAALAAGALVCGVLTAPLASAAPAACGTDLDAPEIVAAVATLTPYADTGWRWDTDPRTFSGNYDRCATLSAALVTVRGATASSPVTALMFHGGSYLGTATSRAYGFTSLDDARTTDDTVVLTYDTPGTCNACAPAAVTTVRYQWRGDHVAMLDAPPS